jgi:hypothetical protein
MKFKYFFTIYVRGKYLAHLLLIFYLLAIFGSVIIGHAGTVSDDCPIVALQSAAIMSNIDEVAFLKAAAELISLPLLNKHSLLTRAPPYTSQKSA